ncbi:MAG: protoporphyrinogen oxidase [Gemmatimonadota bacterium]
MIVVVGAGITGLAIAEEVVARGEEVMVLEASPRVGGVIHSAEIDGHVVDWGPQRGRLTPPFKARVERLGLQDDLLLAPDGIGLLVYARGRLRRVPLDVSGLLASDALSVPGRLRLLGEFVSGGARPGESVRDYFVRKFGREAYLTLAAPLFGGLYASDPAEMDVEIALAPLLRRLGVKRSLLARGLRAAGGPTPRACSFRGGMEQLPQAMARALGDRVVTETPVRRLKPNGARWTVESTDAVGPLDARAVVLATPAAETARLLETTSPDASSAVASLGHNPLAIVHLTSDFDVSAMGFQVAFEKEHGPLRGITFQHALFGRDRLFTAFLGGATCPEIVQRDDADVARAAEQAFERTTGQPADTVSVYRTRMPAWDRSWRAIQDLAIPAGLHVAGSWHARPGIPGRFAEAHSVAERLVS